MVGRADKAPPPPPKPARLTKSELETASRDYLLEKYHECDDYIHFLENVLEERHRVKTQLIEVTRRENSLVMKLTLKEQQLQELQSEVETLRARQIPQNSSQLRATLLDPAVNMLFEKMRQELDQTKNKLEETQNELSAWKFTPDSNTGKRLMAKCRLLYQENEDLGKMISSGRLAKLEGDLALHKSFAQEMKTSQQEQDEFLLELDEEVEGMQSTIYYLQQELREAKETILRLEKQHNGSASGSGAEDQEKTRDVKVTGNNGDLHRQHHQHQHSHHDQNGANGDVEMGGDGATTVDVKNEIAEPDESAADAEQLALDLAAHREQVLKREEVGPLVVEKEKEAPEPRKKAEARKAREAALAAAEAEESLKNGAAAAAVNGKRLAMPVDDVERTSSKRRRNEVAESENVSRLETNETESDERTSCGGALSVGASGGGAETGVVHVTTSGGAGVVAVKRSTRNTRAQEDQQQQQQHAGANGSVVSETTKKQPQTLKARHLKAAAVAAAAATVVTVAASAVSPAVTNDDSSSDLVICTNGLD